MPAPGKAPGQFTRLGNSGCASQVIYPVLTSAWHAWLYAYYQTDRWYVLVRLG